MAQPRRIIIHAATGESMPPDSITSADDWVATGKPPGPVQVCDTMAAFESSTRIWTVCWGLVRSTPAAMS